MIDSPHISLEELRVEVPTLLSERTDRQLARRELTESSLYRQLLTSVDGRTTVLLATLGRLPYSYITFIVAGDAFLDMFRTSTNVRGDSGGALVVNRLERGKW